MTGASRFLIGSVACFATHDGIPPVARAAWRRQVLGATPSSSAARAAGSARRSTRGRRTGRPLAIVLNPGQAGDAPMMWPRQYASAEAFVRSTFHRAGCFNRVREI